METLFMVFMTVVAIMSLFAVMVVLRDIVKEITASKKGKDDEAAYTLAQAERIIAAAKAMDEAAAEPVIVVEETKCEDLVEEIAEEVAEAPAEVATEEPVDADGTISFAKGQQQTLEEKYLALSNEQRGWYDEIIKYACAVEGSKRFKNARYEEYKVGASRIVRMLIKRGTIQCEFILHNSDFTNYINENKISVKQSATTMIVDSAATVDAVKSSIDIVVAQIAEEKEYKKNLAREKRKAARAKAAEAESAEAEAVVEV